MNLNRSKGSETPINDNRLDVKLNLEDLEILQKAFSLEGDDHNNIMSFNREQFVEALSFVLCKGTREGYSELFDKIDITREGFVDWEKFASYMLIEFYEKDDRTKSSSLPQWKEVKNLAGPHKDTIQGIILLKNMNRYLSISKEGNVGLWGSDLKLQRSVRTLTDSCRLRDLWVTDFAYLGNINKVAVSFTSKEIAFYDMGAKLDFNCQIKLKNLPRIPICMDFWSHPDNTGEAILVWGDAGGHINVISWTSATLTLFERMTAKASDKDENMTIIDLTEVIQGNIKACTFFFHKAHDDWVRKVSYLPNLECFVSCSTNWNTSMTICWLEKQNPTNSMFSEMAGTKEGRGISRTSCFTVHQGINSFAYNENTNLIATAGVNSHVCLWNPYVVSKPNGILRGHITPVTDVQFNKNRGLLFSFSKDKILRIWDIQLQVCIQRLAGMFPKGQEINTKMLFHEDKMRLFMTFNMALIMLEMKPDVKDRTISHDKPLIGCLYNSLYNQVVTGCQGGIVYCWMVDTGQRVKTISEICDAQSELTCIAQDSSQTRLYTGSTDGNVKIWDFNGRCYHTLICANRSPVDIGQIAILKRCILAFGFSKHITAFWTSGFKGSEILPSEWNGNQSHGDDILVGASIPPHAIATGAYDGEIIIWNINSEQVTRTMSQRSKKTMKQARKSEGIHKATNGEPTTSDKPESGIDNIEIAKVSTNTDSVSGMMESMFNVSRLIYLETRKIIKLGTGASLVSCGGNGIVRFWNLHEGWLVGEFVAHEHASSIIMNIDATNQYLATADMDGKIKIWDILDYCISEGENQALAKTPDLVSEWQAHADEINGIAFCSRFNRILIITSSSDQSAALWELNGYPIGIFGQETRWKLSITIERSLEAVEEVQDVDAMKKNTKVIKYDPDWVPDPEATENPAHFRINTWKDTTLGKNYQELRIKKRERIQPSTIPDLPYLFGEKLGKPAFGPFYSLDTSNFDEIDVLNLPEFMDNPHKYFNATENNSFKGSNIPLTNETLRAVFDERAILPKYILDFEQNFRSKLRGHNTDIKSKTVPDDFNSAQELRPRNVKNVRLQPIHESLKQRNKTVQKLDSQ